MRNLMTCALGGIGLLDVDERVYIDDIEEEISISQDTAKRPGYGQFPLNAPRRDSLIVTITFMVKERDRTARASVIQTVRGWAKEGWLTLNIRPNQQLYVFCTKLPETKTFEWTERMEIQFTAYGEAYWQEIVPVSVNAASAVSSDTRTIMPNGTQDCFLEAEIKPSSGTLTSVSIAVGTQTLALSGLSVTKTAPLQIYYDALHLLHIESGGSSLLSKRSAASADDIILAAGQANTVILTFSRACTYTIKARGLYR